MNRDQAQQKLNKIAEVAINHALWCMGVTTVIGVIILFFTGNLFDTSSIRNVVSGVVLITIGTYMSATRNQTFQALIED